MGRRARSNRWSPVALVPLLVVACVGDEPGASGAAATGSRHGACYPNGTCDAELACNDGVCLRPGETPDGGAGGEGGGADAGGRADATPCEARIAEPRLGPSCPVTAEPARTCAPGVACCALLATAECGAATCDPPDTSWDCTAAANCASGVCCLDSDARISNLPDRCPAARIDSASSSTCVQGGCPSSQPTLCATSADCGSRTCTPTAVDMGGVTIILGVCF